MAISACSLLNQNALGLGLFGKSGSMKKPAIPQTTVMMALITKSHLLLSVSEEFIIARGY
jgi:hypothetical protein